jgi:hypothetical protein
MIAKWFDGHGRARESEVVARFKASAARKPEVEWQYVVVWDGERVEPRVLHQHAITAGVVDAETF